ncbi:flavin-binding monooxygenase [Fusarium mundagurra]|uniref:Flavin-binding monooxygenase n=1 Tax=Fusarium mundagurra TaxID=1567541 RepID=A0A8H5Y8W5_9HYPO|nr:flavin-binding monooxygenase [Fusarium mundagurra]
MSDPAHEAKQMESLDRLVEQNGNLDDDTRARIESGHITLQAILKAGLDALQLQQGKAHFEPTERSEEELQPGLRTDKILVTRGRMHGYPNSFLPNAYTNHLHMKQFLMVAALRANAELLEVTFQQLTDPDTISPFYVGDFSISNPDITVAGVGAKFLHLKPDLRPTAAQINRRHHPYMDLFPCPIFRQRMIELTTAEPPIIDEGDLCRDIEKDGIICWGSQLSGDHAATGSGVPWDIRSWEMEPWFLRKWWFVVGGSDGAFYHQKRLKPDLADKIVPDFPPNCRRLIPGPGYLEAISQPNVSYIQTPIQRFMHKRTVTNDRVEREVDVVICATGANVDFAPPCPVISNGIDLHSAWKPGGLYSHPFLYLGIAAPGFPNLAFLGGAHAWSFSSTIPNTIENHRTNITEILRKLRSQGIATITPSVPATEDFIAYCNEFFPRTVFTANDDSSADSKNCTSWYNGGTKGGSLRGLFPASAAASNYI